MFALWIVIHVLYLTGVGLCSGTLRTDCLGQWPPFYGRRVLSPCTARTTPTFFSTCAALSVEFCPSVEPLTKSLPTKMESGISRTRSEFVHVLHFLSLVVVNCFKNIVLIALDRLRFWYSHSDNFLCRWPRRGQPSVSWGWMTSPCPDSTTESDRFWWPPDPPHSQRY